VARFHEKGADEYAVSLSEAKDLFSFGTGSFGASLLRMTAVEVFRD
jgi:hypothetical protein